MSEKSLARAIAALQVYLDRGERVLQLIHKKKLAQALELLKWRNAAYHNYRYYDQLKALDADDPFKELIEKIAAVNLRLGSSLEGVRMDLFSQLAKLQKEKSRNKKYQSAKAKAHSFTRTI